MEHKTTLDPHMRQCDGTVKRHTHVEESAI